MPMPWNWWGGWWGGWVMSIGQIAFWIVVVALIIWLARHWSGARQAGPPQTPLPPAPPLQTPPPVSQWTVTEDAVAVVKRRYAAGEIDRDEYLQKLSDLGAPPVAGPCSR